MRVLLALPDASLSKSLELWMKAEGMNVFATDHAEEAVDLAKIYDYDLVLLGDVLLDGRGLDALRQVRAARVKSPIIMLAHGEGIDPEVHALDAGADDYVRMPFHRDVLISRLRSVIRRSQGHASTVIEAGPVALDIGTRQVRVGGTLIHLTGKEYAILEALALRKGLVLSKDMLLNQLYGGMDEPDVKIIDVFVCKLRNKLRAYGAQRHLETSWGRGYRLVDTPENPTMAEPPPRRGPVQAAVLAAVKPEERGFVVLRRAVGWASQTAIRNALDTLLARGEVVRVGSGRNTAYRLPEGAGA